jgi:hypothetical protein
MLLSKPNYFVGQSVTRWRCDLEPLNMAARSLRQKSSIPRGPSTLSSQRVSLPKMGGNNDTGASQLIAPEPRKGSRATEDDDRDVEVDAGPIDEPDGGVNWTLRSVCHDEEAQKPCSRDRHEQS